MFDNKKMCAGSIGVVGAMVLASYALFALSARRPLSLSESLIFSSALLRATPSSLAGGNWIEAVGLARQALASPVSRDSYVVAGHRYDVPPRTRGATGSAGTQWRQPVGGVL